jgi:hypothetical protein
MTQPANKAFTEEKTTKEEEESDDNREGRKEGTDPDRA